jgi:DNA-binding NarL/FixJ family response regulator
MALTMQETNVLQQVCEGKSNKEIADLLKISANTVGEHIKNIYLKLQVNNRIALYRKALLLGLVACPVVDCKLKVKK